MKEITPNTAFSKAPPKHPAVLCVRGAGGGTDLIKVEWFSWLNTRRQPMITYSMFRDAGIGQDLRDDDPLVLAFPPVEETQKYKAGIHAPAEADDETALPDGIRLIRPSELKVAIPAQSRIVLACSVSHAYNYPFKKVRIFNCDLEAAYDCEG